MTKRDREIIATLTTAPQWVEAWQEYAAVDNSGVLHTAEDSRKLAATVAEANELIARHAKECVTWEQAMSAAKVARENIDELLAEMQSE